MGLGIPCFSFSSHPGSTKADPTDRRPFLKIRSTIASSSSGDCFAILFPLMLFLLFGVCLGSSSSYKLFSPIQYTDSYSVLSDFCYQILEFCLSIFFPRLWNYETPPYLQSITITLLNECSSTLPVYSIF